MSYLQYLETFCVFSKNAVLAVAACILKNAYMFFVIDHKIPYLCFEIVFLRKSCLIPHYPQFTLF